MHGPCKAGGSGTDNDSPLGELFYRLILIGKRETKAADIEMDKGLKRE
jgi:hypothetical protein